MIDLIEKDHPIGLGFRVPMIIVSPWTRGGYVYSGVADHTSSIKFLEKRFNFTCENISPWRRAIASDLLDAFDFKNPDYSWPDHLPDTSDNYNKTGKQCHDLPKPVIPKTQSFPKQEPGTKKSRSLPYDIKVNFSFESKDIWSSSMKMTIEVKGG